MAVEAYMKFPNHLRQAIKQCGLTIQNVATETGIPLRTLFDYCAGRVPIPKERLESLASMLGYPSHHLVPAFPVIQDPCLVQYEDEQASEWILSGANNSVDNLRRKLLQQLLSATSTTSFISQNDLINPDSWERLSLALNNPYRIDNATVTHLEGITHAYWDLYRSAIAKVDLLNGVSGHLLTITQLLRASQPLAMQSRLSCIASNTSQILGEIYFDMNKLEKANAYYTLAIEAAHEVDNHALESLALGRKGFLSVYKGEYLDALPLFKRAYSLAENTTTGKSKSWLTMMEAETLSNLKKKDDCLFTLEKTEEVFDQDRSPTGEDKHWTGFTYATMMGYKGSCYIRLQLPHEAQSMLNTALNDLPSGPTRRKSLLLSELALTYIQQKEIEEACKIASQALLCAAQTKSPRALKSLKDIQRELRGWRDTSYVKRFNHHLNFVKSI